MKRLGRRLFNLAAGVSLVICLATVVLWARSYFKWDRGFLCGSVENDAQRVLDFWSQRGHITIKLTRTEGFSQSMATKPRQGASLFSDSLRDAWTPQASVGFLLDSEVSYRSFDYTATVKPRDTTWTVVVPHWFGAALMAVLPFVCLWRWRAEQRNAIAGLCPTCGYDLRATPARCPECGTIPNDAKGAAT
jgi:hypothetical protein